jgi:Ras GTPase-activating-like protein IQGAP2/3
MILTMEFSAPEVFDIVTKTIADASRMNLAQISTILTQITSGSEFDDDKPIYVPINDFVRKAITELSAWLVEGNTFILYWVPVY